MTSTTPRSETMASNGDRNRAPTRPARVLLHLFLIAMAILFMLPLVGAIYSSFRPFSETLNQGYFSLPDTLTLDNYRNAWSQGEFIDKYWNTALILFPSLSATLFLSSMVAFGATRFSWRFNIGMLVFFTAGNLLPQQIIIQPLFQMYKRIPLPDVMTNSPACPSTDIADGCMLGSNWGIILIHVAFQSGFCTFVLSNYMKLLPASLTEAALVDGASVWTMYWRIIMPLTRPALAALATLEFTWIYNDFFWAVVLEQQGADRPITSSLANLGGEFFTDDNLIAAASMYVALPTLMVYLALQRHFIAGLSLGASKG